LILTVEEMDDTQAVSRHRFSNMKTVVRIWLATLALTFCRGAAILTNGGFESGLGGWRPLWTRDAKVGTLILDSATAHRGKNSARVEHRGENDWSLEPALRVPVQAGDVFELEAWLKLESRGASATLCVSTHDAPGKALDWSYGERSLHDSADWQRVQTRFIVPPGVAQIQPRLIGHGPLVVWLDDYSLERTGNVSAMRPTNLLGTLGIKNSALEVSLSTSNATLSVLDRRTGQRFEQNPLSSDVTLTGATTQRDQLQLKLFHVASGQEIAGTIRLEHDLPEFTFELVAQGELPNTLRFPHPFASRPGEYLVVPMNEGISYPVEDQSIEPFSLIAYGGHGICMAFWGSTDGARGYMAIIETPDDASIRIERHDGLLAIAPQWDAQRGQFGYD